MTQDQERPSPASSDDTTTTTNISDQHLSPPPSPSISFDSAYKSDASTSSSSVVSDGGSSGSEPVVSKKPRRPPVRSWPASDEIALLEAVADHREKHGRLPSPKDLAAALRGAEGRLSADQISRRLRALRSRYDNAALRLSRGTVPVKDDDVTIYRLSKRIWAGTRRGKREKKTRAADARKDPREFGELAGLYPCLSAEVEAIDAGSGAATAGVLKRAFGRIGDDTAARLEATVKIQRLAEARSSAALDRLRTNVTRELLRFVE